MGETLSPPNTQVSSMYGTQDRETDTGQGESHSHSFGLGNVIQPTRPRRSDLEFIWSVQAEFGSANVLTLHLSGELWWVVTEGLGTSGDLCLTLSGPLL